MAEIRTSSDPPTVTVVDISDPTEANAGIELLDLDAVQLQSNPLQVRRVMIRLDPVALVFHSTNLRVRTRTRVHPGFIAYVTFGPQSRGTINGLPIRPGLMLAAESGTEHTFVASGGWESITFVVPPAVLEQALAARQRQSEFRLPEGLEALQVDDERVRNLFNWGRRLVEAALQEPGLFDEQARERFAIRNELLDGLLAALHAAEEFETTRSDRTRQAQGQIVKKAEDFAVTQSRERLCVTDLCRAVAVSERTLEYAFKEITGLSPVTYLGRLRLHRVRQALLAAAPGSTTVTAEAMNWGFWHFGEFSRAYKVCFGELPSETLRRTS